MKKTTWLILNLILFCEICFAEEYRTFTDKNDRKINAMIVKFDQRASKVTVKCENGRKSTVPVDIFSTEDQTYIREWLLAQEFMNPSRFKIEIQKKKGEKPAPPSDKSSRETNEMKGIESVFYVIKLDNRGLEDLSNLSYEYWISGSRRFKPLSAHKKSDTFNLTARDSTVILTDEIPLYRHLSSQQDSSTDSYGNDTTTTSWNTLSEDKISGIRFKVIFKTQSGNTFTREKYFPRK